MKVMSGNSVKFRRYVEVLAGVAVGAIGVYQVTCAMCQVQPAVITGALCGAFGLGLILVGITEHPRSEDSGKLNGQ